MVAEYEANSLEMAKMALDRAYCCNYGEGVAACSLLVTRRAQTELFLGASVALEMGPLQPGALSPLCVALVALSSHGGSAE
ncbi:unnamed protein product, partial [Durusdinium trenchii]